MKNQPNRPQWNKNAAICDCGGTGTDEKQNICPFHGDSTPDFTSRSLEDWATSMRRGDLPTRTRAPAAGSELTLQLTQGKETNTE